MRNPTLVLALDAVAGSTSTAGPGDTENRCSASVSHRRAIFWSVASTGMRYCKTVNFEVDVRAEHQMAPGAHEGRAHEV